MNIDDAKVRTPVELTPRKPLLAKRTSAFNDFNRSEIVYLAVDQLIPFKNQARKIFDDKELESLASTIREHGIRQPLTVLAVQSDPVCYEVISGERRLRASKIAGLTRVPCIVLQNSEKAEEIALIENIQRQDLHPIELSRALSKICEARGWGGQTELKSKLGLSSSTISELLKLGSFSHNIQEKILEKNIRGREYFRKLFSLKTDEARLKEIDQFKENQHSKEVKYSQTGSRSLLRVAIGSDGLKIQRGKLTDLSSEERERVKNALLEIINSL